MAAFFASGAKAPLFLKSPNPAAEAAGYHRSKAKTNLSRADGGGGGAVFRDQHGEAGGAEEAGVAA